MTSNGTNNSYNPKDAAYVAIVHEDLIIFKKFNQFPSHGVQHPLPTTWIVTGTVAAMTSTKCNLTSSLSLSKAIQQIGMTIVAQGNAVLLADVHHLHSCQQCPSCGVAPGHGVVPAATVCFLDSRQLLLPSQPPSSNQCLAYLPGHKTAINYKLGWVESKLESKGMAHSQL